MRLLFLLTSVVAILSAQTYQVQIEPNSSYSVISERSGKVVYLDSNDELKTINGLLLQIEDSYENQDRLLLKKNVSLIEKQIKIKRENLESLSKIAGKSKFEKDTYRLEILSLEVQKEELLRALLTLDETIKKKKIEVKGCYLKELSVENGEYVSAGSEVALCEDHSQARLTLYITAEDRKNIFKKEIKVEGVSEVLIDKVSNSTDSTYISSYKLELVIPSYKEVFGKVVKVTIKDVK